MKYLAHASSLLQILMSATTPPPANKSAPTVLVATAAVAMRVMYSLETRIVQVSWALNKPMSQIPQCIRQISHNATFVTECAHTCTFLLQNAALGNVGLVRCVIIATGLWVIWRCQLSDCQQIWRDLATVFEKKGQ